MRENGVAVLSISGVIANKANMFTRVSGGASAQLLAQQVESMRADPRVRAVVLDLDTPGGNVLGIPALGESIRALASEKPTVSVCTGMMASAGYWVGSAANAVYISGLTDYVGSIGVVATHSYDPRRADGSTTEITAGKYKRINSESGPLTAEGREYMQSQVDHLYSVFVETVAQNRRVSADDVLANMADGKIFIGQQAIDAGLVDGVSTVDAMVEQLAASPDKFTQRRKARFGASGGALSGVAGAAAVDEQANDEPVARVATETNLKGAAMSAQELAAKFAAENPEAAQALRGEGAAAELARIQSVRAAALPGHEALIESLAMDGKTSGAEAALAVVAAERTKVQAAGLARSRDAIKPVAQVSLETDPGATVAAAAKQLSITADSAAVDAAAKEYQAANPGTSYILAVKAVTQKGA
jgi:signal peptide peptidase SppA